MTSPLTPARPLAWVFAAVIAASALVPPETSGDALAGIAGLVLLGAALVAASGPAVAGAGALLGAVAAGAWAARLAFAPGPAVLPVATAALAAVAGIAARSAARAGSPVQSAAASVAAAGGAFVGARGVYEAVYGLRALADRVRAEAASIPSADVVLGRLEQGRAYAGFPTPAAAGGFLSMAIPITVALAVAGGGRRRVLWSAAAVLEIAGLVSTRSLTAAGALVAALALAALMLRSRRVALAAGAVVVAVGVLASLRAGEVFSRTTDDSPWALRAGNVRIALAIAGDHPWRGVGPGGYAEAFPRYRGASDNEARHAHCLPAEMVAELGIPLGLGATFAIFALFVGPLFSERGRGATLERGIAVGLAAFAVHNLADFTFYLPSILFPALLLRAGLSQAPRPAGAGSMAARLSFAATALLAAGVVAMAGLSDAAVDRATEAAREGRAEDAAREARRAARLAPWSVEAALVASQAEAGVGRLAAAAIAADRAVRLAPGRGSVREVRARMRGRLGDTPGLFSDLVEAARDNPRRPEYRELRDRARASLP